ELEDLDWHWHDIQQEEMDFIASVVRESPRLKCLRMALCNAGRKMETLFNNAPSTVAALETMELWQLRTTPFSSLSHLCFKFGTTLTSLSLSRIFLEEGSWADFFRTASTSLPKLRCITLNRLS